MCLLRYLLGLLLGLLCLLTEELVDLGYRVCRRTVLLLGCKWSCGRSLPLLLAKYLLEKAGQEVGLLWCWCWHCLGRCWILREPAQTGG